MSKIGKKPILLPEGVAATAAGATLTVTGKNGAIAVPVLPFTNVAVNDGAVQVTATASGKQGRANWGTMAALVRNAIAGVSQGFTKKLEIEGIGFRAQMEGNTLVLSVGFTHPVKFTPPANVKIAVEKSAITVSGIDKQLVGETAARIRKIKKPEPYKGKGIRYAGEAIRRKAGKKVAGTGTSA